MHFRILLSAVLIAAVSRGQAVSNLNLSITSGGTHAVTVSPGSTVAYVVTGTLSNDQNDGLAMFSLDLAFSGGPLAQAATPASGPMVRFTRPQGFTNPAGYGGTQIGGALIQVGGAQNTINNSFASFPIGAVQTHLAWPMSPQVLVTGTLTAPLQVGTFTLAAANVFANAIRQGETGFPFWKVDCVGAGSIVNLLVSVRSLSTDVSALSISNPGVQNLSLDAGPAFAGRVYWLVGTYTGTSPGLPISGGLVIPLNYDSYFQYTLDYPNSGLLQGSLGMLNALGRSTAVFTLPPGLPPQADALTLHHAFVTIFPLDLASNAVVLDFDP